MAICISLADEKGENDPRLSWKSGIHFLVDKSLTILPSGLVDISQSIGYLSYYLPPLQFREIYSFFILRFDILREHFKQKAVWEQPAFAVKNIRRHK